MRILAIRGKNLASLGGEFEVDFRAEPLKSAGVFAISGPTGAGKSTLLDALCLALYHDTPRLLVASERNVSVPDVDGETLSPRDPRNLLRRGCASGHAEVDFVGIDGREWRARWSVLRARGKPDGRLQQIRAQLADADGAHVSGTTGEIRAAIEHHIGLSFDQFRRAVLLAQNDFAALLKAKQDERADLLEALTGTEIYSRVSRLAHARNREEQDALQELQQQLKLQSPLDEIARAELETRITRAQQKAGARKTELDALNLEATWHSHGQTLGQKLATSQVEHDRLQQAMADDAPLGVALDRWNRLAPLRPIWVMREDALEQIRTNAASLPALGEAKITAAEIGVQREQAAIAARQGCETAEKTQRDAQPVIAAARRLDENVRAADKTQAECRLATQALATEHEALAQQHADAGRERAKLSGIVEAWPLWQDANTQLRVASDQWPMLGDALRDAVKGMAEREHLAVRFKELSLASQSAKARTTDASAALEQAKAEVHSAQEALHRAETAHAALEPEQLAIRRRGQHQQRQALDRLHAAGDVWVDAQAREHECRRLLDETTARLDRYGAQVQRTSGALESAAQAEHDATHAFERVRVIADAHTIELRQTLRDGEPCPVCGATEHLGAQQPGNEVDALLKALKADSVAATEAHRVALAALEQAKAQTLACERQQVDQTEDVARAGSATSAAFERVLTFAAEVGAQALETLGVGSAALIVALPAWADALDAQERILVDAETALAESHRTTEDARQRAKLTNAASVEAQGKLDTARSEGAVPLQETAHCENEIARIAAALDATLRGLTELLPSTNADALAVGETLALWQAGEATRKEAAGATAALAEATATCRTLEAQHVQLADKRQHAEQALATAISAQAACVEARRTQLDHSDVEAYAAALAQAALDARTLRDNSDAQRIDAQQALTVATHALEGARRHLAERAAHVDDLGARLLAQLAPHAEALAVASPTLEDLAELLIGIPDDLDVHTRAWKARETALSEARSTCRTLQQQHEEWRAQNGSSREAGAVQADLENAKADNDTAQQLLGGVLAERQSDDQRRAAASADLALLTDRQQAARRWTALAELIGSADGSKFKRYAQQFTLEVLLEYANAHLLRLSPRYRLRRGNEALSLLVVDLDLGDELRSVHSLSGGETFLVSLALALGLASLSSQRVRVESLFIDEGFGSLDAETLNMAMGALDRLHADGRRVGIISHVADMAERIGVHVAVTPVAPGRSVVSVANH